MNFIEEVTGYKLYYYQMITIPASISSTVKKKVRSSWVAHR